MSDLIFEIRTCLTCRLRYPLEKDSKFGARCPQCLGETKVVSSKIIHEEHKTRSKTTQQDKVVYAVLLDSIRSAWNVGSILRSADGFGFEHVYVCGITPTPKNEAVKKTSLGAEEIVAWSYHKDAVRLVENLKAQGWNVYALEETENSKPLPVRNEVQVLDTKQKAVLIVGNEVTGIDIDLLAMCDEVFEIPMQGEKRSLNVAIAFSVAAFVLGQDS